MISPSSADSSNRFGQRLKRPALVGELDPALLGLPDELVEQLLIQRIQTRRPLIDLLLDHGLFHFHHAHQMQLHDQELHRRPYSLRPSFDVV